jgi:hypothetical protein
MIGYQVTNLPKKDKAQSQSSNMLGKRRKRTHDLTGKYQKLMTNIATIEAESYLSS